MVLAIAHLRNCILALALAPTLGAHACGTPGGLARIVEAGERGELRMQDGRTLRLAGLDVSDVALDRIADAWVERDVRIAVLAPAPDRWGRLLADVAAPDGSWLSDDLLGAGAARVKPEFETRACEAARLAAERPARERRLGLWGEPGAVLRADRGDALAAAAGRFVLVEGVVSRVGVGRARVYLDFGGRGAFSVVVTRKAEAPLERRGVRLSAMSGQSVRVRGYLDDRFGPRIAIDDPLMIEGAGGTGPGG